MTYFRGSADPQPVQFLTKDGEYQPSESAAEFADELSAVGEADYQQWYTDMVETRAFDRECTNLQRQGQLALWVPAIGQEGCQAGITHAATGADHIFPSYREHTVAKIRGVNLVNIAAVFRGLTLGGWDVNDPRNGNVRNYTMVLGAQAQHAAGYALGQLLDAKASAFDKTLDPATPGIPSKAATLAFYGDGTTSQGDASESMIFAASYQAPVLFVVQNNQWAISVPVARQSRTPLYRRALGFGLDAVQIDGNDPLAAYAVAKRFLDDARAGRGPRLIEALTYRMGAHTTSDDPTRYRPNDELSYWEARDPILRMRLWLQSQGVAEEFFVDVDERAKEQAYVMREQILTLPEPDPQSMFDFVYADEHPRMNEQADWLERYENSFLTEESEA